MLYDTKENQHHCPFLYKNNISENMEGCPPQKFIVKANDQMQQHLQISYLLFMRWNA